MRKASSLHTSRHESKETTPTEADPYAPGPLTDRARQLRVRPRRWWLSRDSGSLSKAPRASESKAYALGDRS